MHGRPRKPVKPEDPVASAAKAEKLRSLQTQLLHNHRHRIYNEEAVEISSKLLEINPEVYTAWNYRKLAVQNSLASITDPPEEEEEEEEEGGGEFKSILDRELKIAEVALRRNPKCYGAWHHRKWVIKLGLEKVDYDLEFRLLDQLLKADSRNFHGWNHRRFVAALKNVPEEEELKFTTDKIDTNFSNYSAWHNRSIILSHLMKQKAPRFASREQVLMEEFELIHQALFTDPDDQSGWFYHLWLLDQTIAPDAPFLVSSWPSDGSELLVSSNTCVVDCKPFRLAYNVPHRIFPVVLYFNQVVKGVNATTVTVESIFSKNDEFIWQPLSTNNSAEARSWVTYLKIPDVTCNSPRIYSVKVNLGHSQGLISSTGCPFSHTYQFGFTLDVRSHGSECTGSDYDVNTVDWDDGNFYCSPSPLQNGLPNTPFEQLRITKDCDLLASKWHIESLSNEINLFQELISEMHCKIAKLTVARLLIARDVIMSREILPTEKRTHFVETLQLYDDLMKLDPSHIGYYMDQRSLVLLDQITSDKESLAKHCWHHKELASKSVSHSICVRFDRLSLTRIGSIERILWVSMLDLSHNALQSIEGLEAMQLLSYLNLSNNKISSITALEPLRMIKSLKILDISYNEIGAHSIDTKRYLCASPLSHKFGCIGSIGEFEHYGNGKIDYWEATLIFKDLRLTQLSVVGNPVFNESFSMLLLKLIPSLEWFDGRHIRQVGGAAMGAPGRGPVAVTGAAGYIGSWLVKRLLEEGYTVRATLRDPSSSLLPLLLLLSDVVVTTSSSTTTSTILSLSLVCVSCYLCADDSVKVKPLLDLPGSGERLTLWKADLTEHGSFDAVVDSCTGVFHVATPMDFTTQDPEKEMVQVTVDGVVSLLESCRSSGTVERVVFTSSAATVCVHEGYPTKAVYDETSWSDVDFVRRIQIPGWSYVVAKTIAEKAAWEFAREKGGVRLVTVVPPLVVGAFISSTPSQSMSMALALITGDKSHYQALKQMPLVHLDDLCNAHIFLLEQPEADGRYICSSHDTTIFQLADMMRKRYPDYHVPTQFEGIDGEVKPVHLSSKKLKDLGFEYKHTVEEMFDGAINSCKERNLIPLKEKNMEEADGRGPMEAEGQAVHGPEMEEEMGSVE